MRSSGGFVLLPAAPPGTGPSSRTRKDSRPAHFHQQSFGVESYVPAQSRERILALQAHQAQVQAQHDRQWTPSANQPPGHPTHAPSTAWRGTPTPPPATPPPVAYTGSAFSSHAAEYARAGGYADSTLPPPLLQPRPPPPQQSASQLQKSRPPPPPTTTARFSAARPRTSSAASAEAPAQQSSRMHRTRDDSHSPEPSSPTKRFGSTQPLTPSAQQHAVTSLKEKVALALADLESIKSKSYRPNTAAAGSSTSREASLPRPNLTSGGQPHPSILAAAAERAAEELRTAKSILRKLYKKNVQLSADIKQLRTRTSSSSVPAASASLSPRSSDGASMFDEAETKLLADSAASASSPHKRDDDEEEEDPRDEEEGGDEDGFDSPKRSRPRGPKASLVGKNGIGGPSHLLFLLGERDTTINKLQAQVQSLHRKVNGMAGRLELGGSSATPAAESAGSESMFSDASGVDRYQSQLQVLRRSFGDKLRGQMVQLQHMGEPAPSTRVSAYIADLERWLIWEASWRQVEKTALNAQCRQAEKQAQESWVRSRLLEREVQEVQQRFHALDSKTRLIDTQLAAALERNKHLELENLRLKK